MIHGGEIFPGKNKNVKKEKKLRKEKSQDHQVEQKNL